MKETKEPPKVLKELSDKDVEKLIVVTQGGGGAGRGAGRLDASVAKLIDDGLAMYEQELNEVQSLAQMLAEHGL